ncbi:MAG: hypothetical protein M3512_05555 [Bacteroidota bacterium]|nr:hypothetical protein [Bacteroidota bacterium]
MHEYLFKVSFVIAIALLFYKIFLQQESFFALNRLYFIFSLSFAFIVPIINLPPLVGNQGYLSHMISEKEPIEVNQVKSNEYQFPETENNNVAIPSTETSSQTSRDVIVNQEAPVYYGWLFWITGLYIFGVAIFCINLLFQLGNIFHKIYTCSDKIKDGEYVIINTARKQTPCSFLNYIFIHPDDYDFETYEQIISHEKIHVSLKHSWDLLIAEAAVIVLWFNPIIWWYKRDIEKNLEFQTDALLLENTTHVKEKYQLNLLQIAVPKKPLTITTNYNQSLIKQRIMMMNAKRSNLNHYWKYAFIAPLFITTILFINKPAVSQDVIESLQVADPQDFTIDLSVPLAPEPITEPLTKKPSSANLRGNPDLSQGFWFSSQPNKEYCIDFKGIKEHGNWNVSRCFDKSLFKKSSTDNFIMAGETGTLTLIGALDKEVSQGTYLFKKDPSFEEYLASKNITSKDQNFMFHLHLFTVNRKYIDFVKSKFININGDQLLAMAIHNVDQLYIDAIAKSGFKNLSADQLIAAKIHDVNPTIIKEIQLFGFDYLSMQKIIELRIHDVNENFLGGLKKAGFKDLTIDQAISAKIHGLNPSSIQEIKSLGFGDLSLSKMIELKIHEVDAQYIQGLKASGFGKLSVDEIMQAKIRGLSPAAIEDIKSLGYGEMDLQKMLELKIHNVDAKYIQSLKDVGFDGLTLNQILTGKIHDVNPSTIKELQALGYKNISFNKIVEASIHGIDNAFLNDLKTVGFTNLELEQAIQAKIHGVNSSFIKEARSKGYNLKTIEEYTRVKIHGLARNSDK